LSSFDGTFYWIFTFPFKILMLTAPVLYWWTATAVIDADASALIEYLVPSAAGGVIFICFYRRKFVLPVMTNLSQLLPSFVIAQTVHRRVNKTVWPPVSGHAKGFMQRGRRHPVDLSRAVRPRGYGDYSWHPYQHLRPFGTQRRARLWGQCVLEHLQHRGSSSGGGGLHRAAPSACTGVCPRASRRWSGTKASRTAPAQLPER
jgi:hypothetical protein